MPGNDDYFKYFDEVDGMEVNELDGYYAGESAKTVELKHKYNDLRTKLLSLQVAEQQEKLERLTSPALKDAWDQYQTLLRLTRKN